MLHLVLVHNTFPLTSTYQGWTLATMSWNFRQTLLPDAILSGARQPVIKKCPVFQSSERYENFGDNVIKRAQPPKHHKTAKQINTKPTNSVFMHCKVNLIPNLPLY